MKPTARVLQQPNDGLHVEVTVPTGEGDVQFVIDVERDAEGDWRVFLPWAQAPGDEGVLLTNGHECFNGIVYLTSEAM